MLIKIRRKGGPGSGNWGHAGIPGHQGGSAPSWKSSGKLSDAWKNNYAEFVRRGGTVEIPASWQHFDSVKSGVRANPQRSEDGFGLCAMHSMNAAKSDPSLEVYGGIMLTQQDIDKMESANPMQYWGVPSAYTVHVWNVDSNGKVVDTTTGSRNAGKVYIGFRVNPSDFKTDGELLGHIRGLLKRPNVDNIAAVRAQWERDRNAYIQEHGKFTERL